MSNIDKGPNSGPPKTSFRLDKANAKLAGVCAGLANFFGMDPMVMRLIFVIGTVIGFGSFILLYIAIALIAD